MLPGTPRAGSRPLIGRKSTSNGSGPSRSGESRDRPGCRRYGTAAAPRPRSRTPDKDDARAASVSSLSWADGIARTENPACSIAVAGIKADQPFGRHAEARACSRIASGTTRMASGEAASRSGQRSRVEVIGVLVAGQHEVDARRSLPCEGRAGHPDVRPIGRCVFLGQMLGKVEVDGQHAPAAT